MTPRFHCCLVLVLAACGDADGGGSGSGSGSQSSTTAGESTTTTTGEGGSSEASSGAASSGAVDGSSTGVDVGPIDCRAAGDGVTTLTFINGCDETLSYRGSMIDGGELAPGAHACHDLGDAITTISAIRYWGFVGRDPGGEHHTLAELTLNTDFNDFDWYNISHVDAHNLPMQIVPFGNDECRTLSCPDDLLPDCPEEGRFYVGDELVACYSPERDNPDSPVAQYFEARCADAYSWSGDDADSVATCTGEDFDVVFCP